MSEKNKRIKLERKKIPTPTEFKICPLCGEPLMYQWEDEEMRGFLYCKNPNCEINAIELKTFPLL
jgi:transcription elongation factor Elf1